jgi:hypothetical protein
MIGAPESASVRYQAASIRIIFPQPLIRQFADVMPALRMLRCPLEYGKHLFIEQFFGLVSRFICRLPIERVNRNPQQGSSIFLPD